MAKIAVIATLPSLADTARAVARQLGEPLVVVEGVLERGVAIARRLVLEEQVEAFISRGLTVNALRAAVEVPVTDCNPTAFDLVRSLHAARAHGRRIGFVWFDHLGFDARRLQGILDIELVFYGLYPAESEIRDATLRAIESGVDVLVGGRPTVDVARECGVPVVLLESGPETIATAVRRAHELAEVRRQELARIRQLQAILDFSSDGIVAVDNKGTVTVINPTAAKTFGISVAEALRRPAEQVVPALGLHHVLVEPRGELGLLRSHGNTTLAVNLIPIVVGEQVSGAVATFQDVTRIQKLEVKIRRHLHTKGLVAKFAFEDLVGSSAPFRQALWKARSYAATDSTVLIIGETGTGKELVAQSIHNASARRNGPFVAINCAALPENLLESELFGYEEGAFTGARRGGKAGLFELAHHGTIFLDEINATSLALQARLLRVIQEHQFMRLGGDRVIPLDVRVIAATNQPLSSLVARQEFRADLYYRLNVLKLVLPPLRQRKEDIPELFQHFIGQFPVNPGGAVFELSPRVLAHMKAYPWPGNVRELENFARKYVVIREQVPQDLLDQMLIEELSDADILDSQADRGAEAAPSPLPDIQQLLVRYGGNRSQVARELGVSRTTLWKLLKRAGVVNDEGKS